MNLSLNLAPNPSLSLSLYLSIYTYISYEEALVRLIRLILVQEDIEHFGDVGSLDDNMDSFLSHDGGEGRDLYGTLKPGLTKHKTESSKGFSFGEVGCIRTRNKVTCCHFSSDGKLLASAGHDKKVVLWSMDTLKTEITPEEHQYLITDVRFRPNSSQLATASFDKSLRL
ncbi:transcriptional corepressor LEUNIG_HOMOLOG-like [Camellia sinensis]|uniref:transcriptional corepressor LEUNIG_HOMOLOG-like n=1 Tax=Camellia sinensis TaxID=4442 RepID=UPI00103656E2|nr:transcriptional corepressor LEUNIG_HOMOLOG-like [Camellia sinensis]